MEAEDEPPRELADPYQFFFYSSKLMLIGATLTALALSYHLFIGVSHFSFETFREIPYKLRYFLLCFFIYTALSGSSVPSDFFVERFAVILILGGSASLYYIGRASTPLEKELCLHSLFLSSLSAGALCNIVGNTEVFLAILIYLSARVFLPADLIFFLLLLGRGFLFENDGPALLLQTYFIFCLRKGRLNPPLFLSFYITIIFCCIWLSPIMLQGILFSLSGALAFYFFFVAKENKEHILTCLFYLLNLLFLCYETGKKEATLYLIYIYAFFGLIFALLSILKQIDENYLRVSKFTDYFLFILCKGKFHFFFGFFGLIFLLMPTSGPEWALAKTLFLQVAFLNLFIFFFKSLTRIAPGGAQAN